MNDLLSRAVASVRLLDVQISPDGRQVAYVTAEASKVGDNWPSAIWLVDAFRETTNSQRAVAGMHYDAGLKPFRPDEHHDPMHIAKVACNHFFIAHAILRAKNRQFELRRLAQFSTCRLAMKGLYGHENHVIRTERDLAGMRYHGHT